MHLSAEQTRSNRRLASILLIVFVLLVSLTLALIKFTPALKNIRNLSGNNAASDITTTAKDRYEYPEKVILEVVADCQTRQILSCPHELLPDEITPSFPQPDTDRFLYGKCRDVNIDTRSFCGF